ncbi:RNA polymerase sigma factor [Bacteroidota bacterium]
MHANTEQHCIERVRKGDQGAFSWIMDKYKDMVYTLCVRMLSSEADAEEAAQDVFVKVYKSINSFKGNSKFSTWIYRITYNQCISIIRKKVKMIDLVDEMPATEIDESSLDALEELKKEERTMFVQQALEALPETDAFILTLFYFEELSLEEICEVTGQTNNNVRIRLHRARKKIYIVLKDIMQSELNSIL